MKFTGDYKRPLSEVQANKEVVENPVDIEATNLVMLAVAELHGIVLAQQAEIEALKANTLEGGTT